MIFQSKEQIVLYYLISSTDNCNMRIWNNNKIIYSVTITEYSDSSKCAVTG